MERAGEVESLFRTKIIGIGVDKKNQLWSDLSKASPKLTLTTPSATCGILQARHKQETRQVIVWSLID
jgi:hypothetical protein